MATLLVVTGLAKVVGMIQKGWVSFCKTEGQLIIRNLVSARAP